MSKSLVQVHWYGGDRAYGDYQHRLEQPAANLNRHSNFHVVNIHQAHPDLDALCSKADLVILHATTGLEFGALIRKRRAAGKVTLYECADHWLQMGDWVSRNHLLRHREHRQRLLHYACLCDGIQFSAHTLAQSFAWLNPRGKVFENHVRDFKPPQTAQAPLLIGWAGSYGHRADLAHYAPHLIRFFKDHPNAAFAFMGEKTLFTEIFKDLPADRTRYTPPGGLDEYNRFLQTLDIGLALLTDTPFNRCRSDIKLVEIAAAGALPVIADAPAYAAYGHHGVNCLKYNTPEDLIRTLSQLLDRPDRLNHLRQSAFEHIQDHRNPSADAQKRAEYYNALLPDQSSDTPLEEVTALSPVWLEAAQAADDGHLETALSHLETLLQARPDHHAALALKADILTAGEHWQAVLDLDIPNLETSIWRDRFLELQQAATRALGRNDTPFQTQFEDPVLRLGPSGNDVQHWRNVLAANPFHYEALFRLGAHAARQEDLYEEAVELQRKLLFLYPESREWFAERGCDLPPENDVFPLTYADQRNTGHAVTPTTPSHR